VNISKKFFSQPIAGLRLQAVWFNTGEKMGGEQADHVTHWFYVCIIYLFIYLFIYLLYGLYTRLVVMGVDHRVERGTYPPYFSK